MNTAIPADPHRVLDPADAPTRFVIIGGGPGGYGAALSAARYGASVTLISDAPVGGAAVLTDVVPSKTLIATADVLGQVIASADLGVRDAEKHTAPSRSTVEVDLAAANRRVRRLARQQSEDLRMALEDAGVRIVRGRGHLAGPRTVQVLGEHGQEAHRIEADVVLIAVGGTPRILDTAQPDGERILTWTQLYDLEVLPEHLIVVGSGVTGAEFASAYRSLGCEVTLVSSRSQVLPGNDVDAADVLEDVFADKGITVRSRSRAAAARREGDGVVVTLEDGEEIRGSHTLLALGSIPRTDGLGLEEVGVRLTRRGHIRTDRVSRTTVPGIYAAGDCTGVHPLASVAGTQGRIAVAHALGEAVTPLAIGTVPSAVFTSPEIATVGVSEQDVQEGRVIASVRTVQLARNPRAKMMGVTEGFVKLIIRPGSGEVLGGVVVAPKASEMIHVISQAVRHRLSSEDLARAITVYPSLTTVIAEAARQMRLADDENLAH